jgi:hypothetical protein
MMVCLTTGPETPKPTKQGLKPLNLSSFEVDFSGIWSQPWRSKNIGTKKWSYKTIADSMVQQSLELVCGRRLEKFGEAARESLEC